MITNTGFREEISYDVEEGKRRRGASLKRPQSYC
jgi:hypothetical protein